MILTKKQVTDLAKDVELDIFCKDEPCSECEETINKLQKFAELVLLLNIDIPSEKTND